MTKDITKILHQAIIPFDQVYRIRKVKDDKKKDNQKEEQEHSEEETDSVEIESVKNKENKGTDYVDPDQPPQFKGQSLDITLK